MVSKERAAGGHGSNATVEATERSQAMRPDRVQSFLKRPIIAVLAWTTASGDPMATPVWYQYEDGRFRIYTTYGTAKSRALRRSGRVCLCVQYPTPPHRYVTIKGRAQIIRDRERALQLMERLAYRYLGRLGGRRFLSLAAENQDEHVEHVIIEVTPTKISSLDTASVVNPLLLAAWDVLRRIPGL